MPRPWSCLNPWISSSGQRGNPQTFIVITYIVIELNNLVITGFRVLKYDMLSIRIKFQLRYVGTIKRREQHCLQSLSKITTTNMSGYTERGKINKVVTMIQKIYKAFTGKPAKFQSQQQFMQHELHPRIRDERNINLTFLS